MKTFISAFVVSLALALACNTARSASVTWTNTAGGAWSAPANWSPNQVPGPSDAALLTVAGTYTVTLDSDAAVGSLTLGGTSGTQTLDNPSFNFTLSNASQVGTNGVLNMEGGSLGGGGLLTIHGQALWTGGYLAAESLTAVATNGLLIAGSAGFDDLAGVLTNAGTIRVTNGFVRSIVFSGYGGGVARWVNLPGGLIDLQADVTLDTYTDGSTTNIPVLLNQGIVRKSGGPGTATFNVLFGNAGRVEVESGMATVHGGGSGSGVFQAGPGATLAFDNDYEVDGTLLGAGTNLLSGGTFTLNGSVGGQLTWVSGIISASSTATIATNGLLVAAGGGGYNEMAGVLTNAGTIRVTDGILRCIVYSGYGGGVGRLVNLPGALIDLAGDTGIESYADGSTTNLPRFLNLGMVRKSAGTNTPSFINPFFENPGTLEVQFGTVGLNGGGRGNGVFAAEAGATLAFGNDFEVDSALTGAGTNVLMGGNFTLNGSLTTSNSVLTGSAVLLGTNALVAGTMVWMNGGRIGSEAILTLAPNGLLIAGGPGYSEMSGVLTNAGTIQVTGGVFRCIVYSGYGGGVGQLVNLPGGLVDLQAEVILDTYADGSSTNVPLLLNQGTVRKSGGPEIATLNLAFNNTGTFDMQNGTVNVNGTADLTGGTLNFAIHSLTNFGQMIFAGAPTLTGTISANLDPAYQPVAGDSFPVLGYSSETGLFTQAILPFPDAWQTNYGANVFSLQVLNARPTLRPNASQVVKELTQLSVTNLATDPDLSQTLAFSLISPLPGMTINASSGVFTWTPAQTQSPATNLISVVVTDTGTPALSATNSFTVVVQEVNVAPGLPVVSTQTVHELSLLTVINTATNFNIHSTNFGYGLLSPLAGMSISGSGVFTWTPSQNESPGTNAVTVVATNGNPYDLVNPRLISTNTFTVIVQEVNVPPSLPTVSTQTVSELQLLAVINAATNANIHSTNFGYGLLSPLAGMSISSSGVFTWTPSQAQSPGTNTVTVVATNGNPYDLVNPRLVSTNTFTVVVQEVNVPPSLPTVSTQTVSELNLLTVITTATNANIHSTNFGYGLLSPLAGMSISSSGVFTWTPSQDQSPATNTVTVVATNGNPYDLVNPRLVSTNTFTVVVQEVNVPPSLPTVSTQTVSELNLLTVITTATNANIHSTNFGYGLLSPLAGMSISGSGVFTWTPSQDQSPATNTVTVVATNGNPYDLVNPLLISTNSFTVIVQEVNVAPSLPAVLTQTVNALQLLTVTNTATNANIHSTNFAYALLSPLAGMSISSSGVFTWTPSRDLGPGTNTVTVVVTNGNPYDLVKPHLTATSSFTVIVFAPTLAPLSHFTVNVGQTLSFTASATDNDSTRTLTFSLGTAPPDATIDPASGLFHWRPPASSAGTSNSIQIRVTDNSVPSLSATQSFYVLINALTPVSLGSFSHTPAQFHLQVTGPIGPDYILQAAEVLSSGPNTSWINLLTNTPVASPFSVADTNASTFPIRFYRLKLGP